MKIRYLLALVLVALSSIAGSLVLGHMVMKERLTGEIINVAGRQRMLSQRIGMLLSAKEQLVLLPELLAEDRRIEFLDVINSYPSRREV